jgi:hypothetical protein
MRVRLGNAVAMFRRRKRVAKRDQTPTDVYYSLRGSALESVARGWIAATPAHPRVCGVVVDVPASGGFATIVALADNTTSLYTSVGGGSIGAGEHQPVADANHRLLATIDEYLLGFSIGGDDSLPTAGFVRYHVLGPTNRSTADIPEDCFWGRADHPLMPVIVATQDLISVMRSVKPPQSPV